MKPLCALQRVGLCQHPGDTVEHVIADSVARHVYGDAGPYYTFRDNELVEVDGNHVKPEADLIPMCGYHNNAVLNELFEQPWQALVVGLARGSRADLTAAEVAGVASWLAKTTLMFSLMDGHRPRPADEFDHVLATGRPPDHWSIWVGCQVTHPLHPLRGDAGRDPGPFDFPEDMPICIDTSDGLRLLVATPGFVSCRALGHLVYIVGTNGEGQPFLESPAERSGVLHRAWPNPLPLIWPGPVLLNEAGAKRLGHQYIR